MKESVKTSVPKNKQSSISHSAKGLSGEQKSYLRRLGLSMGAVQLYGLLLEKGRLTAQDASVLTLDFPSAKYRLFYELEKRQLVRRIRGRPLVFEALPLSLGLKASFQDNQQKLRQFIGPYLTNETGGPAGDAKLIVGRQALYDAYIRLADQAKHEICLFSIGIAYSDSLEKVQRKTIKRGVSIKHVVQQRKLSNQHIITKWLRAGVRIKYLKLEQGFHFFVIDNAHVCITFSDPNETENRLSILTDNHVAIELFAGQFRYLWQQAEAIDP